MLRGMNTQGNAGFFDILNRKIFTVAYHASGKVEPSSRMGTRNPLFMRSSGRPARVLNHQTRPKRQSRPPLSQTRRLQTVVQQVRKDGFPPEKSGGPIEAGPPAFSHSFCCLFPPEKSGGPIEADFTALPGALSAGGFRLRNQAAPLKR